MYVDTVVRILVILNAERGNDWSDNVCEYGAKWGRECRQNSCVTVYASTVQSYVPLEWEAVVDQFKSDLVMTSLVEKRFVYKCVRFTHLQLCTATNTSGYLVHGCERLGPALESDSVQSGPVQSVQIFDSWVLIPDLRVRGSLLPPTLGLSKYLGILPDLATLVSRRGQARFRRLCSPPGEIKCLPRGYIVLHLLVNDE